MEHRFLRALKRISNRMYNASKKPNTTTRAKREQRIVRVLIAIAPTMYWETLELALLRYRPHVDVHIADPGEDLDREVIDFEPHVVVCNIVTWTVRESVPYWVVVPYHSSDATIHIQGQGESRVEDISSGDLFTVIDRTEELLSDTRSPEA
jgi:hypothetical protein